MKRVREGVALGVLLLALSAPVAMADSGDDGGKGGKAPEVPVALILPAAAVSAVGFRAFLARKRS